MCLPNFWNMARNKKNEKPSNYFRIYFLARNVFDDSDVHDMDHVRDMTGAP